MPHPLSSEKILITGGTGFIGRHLLKALVDGGIHPTVYARKLGAGIRLAEDLKEKTRWIELDLLDRKALRQSIEVNRPTIIFHLAGTRGSDHQDSVTDCTELNVDATVQLLTAANSVGTRRVIILGSAAEYGRQSGPLGESNSLQPVSIYGESKAEATRQALALHARIGAPVVILRLFTVYGPDQPLGMFVREAVDAAVENRPFSMSEGSQQRDLVFVTDIVNALIAAAITPGIDGKVFNLGGGNPVRLLDVARIIWQLSGSQAPLNVGARARGNDEMEVTWADTSEALKYLDWKPQTNLENGLQATINWARTRQPKGETKLAAI